MNAARNILTIVACGVCLSAVGCTLGRVEPPGGYVPVEHPSPFRMRAVSPEGNAFGFRKWSNPGKDKGDLAYWTQFVRYQKADLGGYQLAGQKEIETDAGQSGTLFEFETGTGQGRYLWLVALFVTPREICAIEAGGPAARIEPDREKIRKAIATFR